MTGFVSFVGSGPGDPELLTLKAVSRLQTADVVLFDDLSSGPVLTHVRADATLVPVGKRAGRRSPSQAEVSELLVRHATCGGSVVRLKSGDPGLFGRLEEEIEALQAARVGFEIIPGISAASAAAAAAAIPLTRRGQARRVQFVTGHDTTGALPDDTNMAALGDPAATTAVFMPKRTFAALAKRLLAAGMAPETPALLAENVSHDDERLTRSSIAGLAEILAEGGGRDAPALILYGPLLEAS